MEYTDFEKVMHELKSGGATPNVAASILDGIAGKQLQSLLARYTREHINEDDGRRLVEMCITASGVTLTLQEIISIVKETGGEESGIQFVMRKLVAPNMELASQLLQELIVDSAEESVPTELLFACPEVKLHCPRLFLECVKICAQKEERDASFAGVVSSVICDRAPDDDGETTEYIRDALVLFRDEVWQRKLDDNRLLEITGGMYSLASILLDIDLIEAVLDFTLVSFRARTPSISLVKLLATPYTTWRDETRKLLPGLDERYRARIRTVDPSAPISVACKQLEEMVFEQGKHLLMKVNPRIVEKQTWRVHRWNRRDFHRIPHSGSTREI